ncbi:MAG: IPTL-CTERM sorting domain-containing protein [Thermoanaerobaculales bacterium]
MKRTRVLLLTALLCVPAAAFASVDPERTAIPTLDEIGLLVLGVILVGGGVFALRRWKR